MSIMKKRIHKYDDELESTLIRMTADEFIEWLKTNEIEYKNPSLLETIKELNGGIIIDEDIDL